MRLKFLTSTMIFLSCFASHSKASKTTLDELPDLVIIKISGYLPESEILLNLSHINHRFEDALKTKTESIQKTSKQIILEYNQVRQNAINSLSLDFFNQISDKSILELKYIYCTAVEYLDKKQWPNLTHQHKEKFDNFHENVTFHHLKDLLPDITENTYQEFINILYKMAQIKERKNQFRETSSQSFFYPKITQENQESFFKLACLLKNCNAMHNICKSFSNNLTCNTSDINDKKWRIGQDILHVLALKENLDAQYLLKSKEENRYAYDHIRGDYVNNNDMFFTIENLASKGHAQSQFDMGKKEESEAGKKETEENDSLHTEGWYKKAAKQGHFGAIEELKKIEKSKERLSKELLMTALKTFNSNSQLSFKYAQSCLDRYQSLSAYIILGSHYEKNNNREKAYNIYLQGHEKGSLLSTLSLAFLLRTCPQFGERRESNEEHLKYVESLMEQGASKIEEWKKNRTYFGLKS